MINPSTDQIHQTLLDGLAVLREHGWMQCEYGEPGGPRCALGALGVGEDHVSLLAKAAARSLNTHLPRFHDIYIKNIGYWNDTAAWEDVEHTFEAAIAATAPIVTSAPAELVA